MKPKYELTSFAVPFTALVAAMIAFYFADTAPVEDIKRQQHQNAGSSVPADTSPAADIGATGDQPRP